MVEVDVPVGLAFHYPIPVSFINNAVSRGARDPPVVDQLEQEIPQGDLQDLETAIGGVLEANTAVYSIEEPVPDTIVLIVRTDATRMREKAFNETGGIADIASVVATRLFDMNDVSNWSVQIMEAP